MTGETVVTVAIANWDIAREWEWEQELDIRFGSYGPQTGTHDRASSAYESPSTFGQHNQTIPQARAGTTSWSTSMAAEGSVLATDAAQFLQIRGRRLRYTLSFDVVTNQPAGESSRLLVENPASQAEWGAREAKFPGWFAFGAVGPIRARIDELAEPRHLHTIDFPIWQRDAAKSKVIADLDAGDYFRLNVRDPIAGLDIAEAVMVMNVAYLLGNGRTPIKRLTVIETGNPVSSNRLFLGPNPLFLDGNPLFLR